MKIIMVHNEYAKYSGEEAAVTSLVDMLRDAGQNVVFFRRSSTEITGLCDKIKAFFCGFCNPFAVRNFARMLAEEKPDVVHVHNLYPLISPAILKTARAAGVPVVMTLHNYRLCCPSGLAFREGVACSLCMERGEWNCIYHNCMDNFPKSFGYALRNWWARYKRYYFDYVSCFLALSEFQKNKLVAAGMPAEKTTVLPNAFCGRCDETVATPPGEGYVAFVGRLRKEKGVDLLLEAARRLPEIQFKFAGDGSEKWRSGAPENVTFCGHLADDAFDAFWKGCRFMVLPSKLYEGFPYSILQAMSYGKPVIVPETGGLPDIIHDGENGRIFKFCDSASLTAVIKELWNSPDEMTRMGQAGRRILLDNYTPDKVIPRLLAIYASLSGKVQKDEPHAGM